MCSSFGRSSPKSTIKRTKKGRRAEGKNERANQEVEEGKGAPGKCFKLHRRPRLGRGSEGKKEGHAFAGDLSLCLFFFFSFFLSPPLSHCPLVSRLFSDCRRNNRRGVTPRFASPRVENFGFRYQQPDTRMTRCVCRFEYRFSGLSVPAYLFPPSVSLSLFCSLSPSFSVLLCLSRSAFPDRFPPTSRLPSSSVAPRLRRRFREVFPRTPSPGRTKNNAASLPEPSVSVGPTHSSRSLFSPAGSSFRWQFFFFGWKEIVRESVGVFFVSR